MDDQLGIQREISGGYDDIVARAETALKAEGFGVLSRIDVKATLKEKIDADFTDYLILGVCNPALAFKALTITKDIGLLLPCNVIVYTKEPGLVVVAVVNPKSMERMLPDVDLSEVSLPAFEKLSAALEKI